MSELKNKVAYLRGLADGLKIDKDSKEGQMLLAIVDALDDMAFELDELYNIVTDIDEDLNDIEEEIYGEDDDDMEDEDHDLFEVNCPNCDEPVLIDDEMLDSEKIICPNCKEEIEFEFDCDCEDCEGC